jgi:hypothetical protein
MTNLTDPKLAHLVARYREWVAEHNTKEEQAFRRDVHFDPYERFRPYIPDYQGFLDWCVRKGLEVSEDEAAA